VAEGAPLLREYVGKTCIEGSNPSGSARKKAKTGPRGPFFVSGSLKTTPPASNLIPRFRCDGLLAVGKGTSSNRPRSGFSVPRSPLG
jgi:hypothetical protein